MRHIVTGIDIGTATTRVVISEYLKGEQIPKIIGIGIADTRGMKHGYSTSVLDVAQSIKQAITVAETHAGVKVKSAYLALGGVGLGSHIGTGVSVISKANTEVTQFDIEKAIKESEKSGTPPNRTILHSIPYFYQIDGKEIYGRPEGMKGLKIEVTTLFITILDQHINDAIAAVTKTGIRILDIVAAPLATSFIALSNKQKSVGGMLVDFGAETTTISVFENGSLTGLHVFPYGSNHITNDIALGLKVSLEQAESIKKGEQPEFTSKRKIDEIIDARLLDIFELVQKYLKKMKRHGLLPAGVCFIGGGSRQKNIDELAKKILALPVRIGGSDGLEETKTHLRDLTLFGAYGVCLASKILPEPEIDSIKKFFKSIKKIFSQSIGELLP